MNPTEQTHPSRNELAAYLAGKLNAVESDNIKQHLAACDACCDLVDSLPTDDTIVAALRQQEAETSVSTDVHSGDVIAPTITPEADEGTQAVHGQTTKVAGLDADQLKLPPELRDHPRYRLVELLGHGGMGDVYRAEHVVMSRQVALKVIKPQLVQNDAAVRRFQREVKAAARLHHSNIVAAYDAEQAGDLHYLVMEFVDGEDLDEAVRRDGSLPVEDACNYIRQTAEGLQYAHELGMVHRDIKPHNLMLCRSRLPSGTSRRGDSEPPIDVESQHSAADAASPARQAGPTVKILDFGLANFANEVAEDELNHADDSGEVGQQSIESHAPGASILHQLTQMGTMMGTPDYIAPEQAQDAHSADIRSDIYSLGCTFYTLLTGQAPFGEGSVLDKVRAHTEKDAPPLSDFRNDVPPEVEAVLLKMMAKDPAERYQTPAEVAEALARFIDQRVDQRLREHGLAGSPPKIPTPLAVGGDDEARRSFVNVANTMLGVAWPNVIFGAFVCGVIGLLALTGAANYQSFAMHPMTLLIAASVIPGILLLPLIRKVRRCDGYVWTVLAALLCMVPSLSAYLGIPLGCFLIYRLNQPKYRLPVRAPPRPSLVERLGFVAILLCPLAFLSAAAVFYIQTDNGVVRVEVTDPSLKVTIAGQTITMDDDGKLLTIRAGEQKLIVRQKDSDFELVTDSFQLLRGDRVALKVDLLPGEVAVTKDGQRFGAKALPHKSSPRDSLAEEWSRLAGRWRGVAGKNDKGVVQATDAALDVDAQVGKMTFVVVDRREHPWNVSIDPTATPKQFDVTMTGQRFLGIYELVADRLTICHTDPGRARPERFGGGDIEYVFRRVESADKNEIHLIYHHRAVLEIPGELTTRDSAEIVRRIEAMVAENPRLVVVFDIGPDVTPVHMPAVDLVRRRVAATGVSVRDGLRMSAMSKRQSEVVENAARRYRRQNDLKEVGLALRNYHDDHKSFPPAKQNADHFDKEGRPHLSWRVHILPYLAQQELYDKFHLDEPWDSEHNEPLLAEMPDVYKTTDAPTRTTLLAVVGEGTAYEGKAGLNLNRDFTDGESNTALAVDASRERAVPWTKPEDLPFDREDPIRAFGTSDIRASGKSDSFDVFLALMADTSVQSIPYDTAPESLRALFTRAGGDSFDPSGKRTTPLPSVSPFPVGSMPYILTSDEYEWTEPVPVTNLNSEDEEAGIWMAEDGLTVLFSSTRAGGSGAYDLWQSRREQSDGEWSKPINLGPPVNSRWYDSQPWMSRDGRTLVFTSTRPGGQGEQDLWITTRESVDDLWPEPVNIGDRVNTASGESGAYLSGDGRRLMFISNRGGTYEHWFTTRESIDAQWSLPQRVIGGNDVLDGHPRFDAGRLLWYDGVRNVGLDHWDAVERRWTHTPFGPAINVGDYNQWPWFQRATNTLYWLSNRPGSKGGADIWMARRVKKRVWPEEPKVEEISLLKELPGPKEWITAVAYPDNDRALTVAVDGVVRVWKNGGAELDSNRLPFGGLSDVSPDGKSVLVASAPNEEDKSMVALWDMEPWKERWSVEFPVLTNEYTPKYLVDVKFAPGGRAVVRSNVESGVAIVDTANGNVLSRFPTAMGTATISPDGKRLFLRHQNRPNPGTFGRIHRIEDGAELVQIDCQEIVLDVVWSRDGSHLILAESTVEEGRVAVFDTSTGTLVRRWVADDKGIESLAPGRKNILVTGGLTRIAVWDWSNKKLLAAVDSPKKDGDARLAIAISPDGRRLISGGAWWLDGQDRLPRLWQMPESVWSEE